MGGGGYSGIPDPTFDRCFVAKDQDTLIEQLLYNYCITAVFISFTILT